MRIIFLPIGFLSLFFPYLISKFSLKKFLVLNLLFALSLLFFYFFQFNLYIQRAYLFRDYQEKKESLLKENNELKLAISYFNNFENLKEKIKERNFERAGLVKYIKLLETDLVIK